MSASLSLKIKNKLHVILDNSHAYHSIIKLIGRGLLTLSLPVGYVLNIFSMMSVESWYWTVLQPDTASMSTYEGRGHVRNHGNRAGRY